MRRPRWTIFTHMELGQLALASKVFLELMVFDLEEARSVYQDVLDSYSYDLLENV